MALPTQRDVRPVLLAILASCGGRARPSEIYPLVTARFDIDSTDLAATTADGRTSLWQNRIQFVRQSLVQEGLIDPTERGIWQLTPTGWESAGTRPPEGMTPALPRPTETPSSDHDGSSPPPPLSPDPTGLAAELTAAATDSANPNRLEMVCGAAFRALGFDAEVIGGAGNTDVVISAPLGVHQYSAVVDAKSTARGRVADAQVDWLSIQQHRERSRADYACIIGPSFSSGAGHLSERATEFGMVLITVEELSELLELHRVAPFALTELRVLFEATPFARAALPALRVVARDRRRLQALVVRVLQLIDNFNRVQPDLVVSKPETLQALALTSNDEELAGTTTEEVSRVLALLEAAGVVTPLPSGGFASTTSTSGAVARIASLAPGILIDTIEPAAKGPAAR